MIVLRDIRFRYDTTYVLNGLNLTINAGDRIGLVGGNGTGKTTLCHIIMGLIKPNAGDVTIFDRTCQTESDFAEVRPNIGFLFQDSEDQLFCPTVLEDIAFGPLNLGKTPEEAKRIVSHTLSALNLKGFEERITYKLSGGEKRLVALATVLAMNPKVLILDEPTSGLDEDTTERLIAILNKSNLTYLVISHDKEFVNKTSSQILTLRNGSIDKES
jgi:cobalt/nickel transport system ATP-binding protein